MKRLTKILFSIIFVLLCLISFNYNESFKSWVSKNVFEENFNFSSFKNYFDLLFPKKEESIFVINDVSYNSREKVDDYYILNMNNDDLVEAIKPGIIVYIGDKDNFSDTIIVQGNDGVDLWYGNVTDLNYSLYDYVSSGDILGTVIDQKLKLKILSNGRILTYEEYIK